MLKDPCPTKIKRTLLTIASFSLVQKSAASQTNVSMNTFLGPRNPEKSWNFILAFSRTEVLWKINAGPGNS